MLGTVYTPMLATPCLTQLGTRAAITGARVRLRLERLADGHVQRGRTEAPAYPAVADLGQRSLPDARFTFGTTQS